TPSLDIWYTILNLASPLVSWDGSASTASSSRKDKFDGRPAVGSVADCQSDRFWQVRPPGGLSATALGPEHRQRRCTGAHRLDRQRHRSDGSRLRRQPRGRI